MEPGTVVNLFIVDKTGRKVWDTLAGVGFHRGELANLRRNLSLVRAGQVRGVDAGSARLVAEVDGREVDPETLGERMTPEDAELLAELGL